MDEISGLIQLTAVPDRVRARLRWSGFALLLAAIMYGKVIADEPKEASVEERGRLAESRLAEEWVAQLGSTKFAIRENATRKLTDAGIQVIPLLHKSTEHPDREVRDRAQQILLLIREQGRSEQIAAFRDQGIVESPLGKIPGWESFSQRLGVSDESRILFSRIVGAEWDLIERIYESKPDQLPAGTVLRLVGERMVHGRRGFNETYSLETSLAILFIATDHAAEFGNVGQQNGFFQLCSSQDMRMALAPTSPDVLVRKLVGDWIIATAQHSEDPRIVLLVAAQFKLPEGIQAALKLLQLPQTPLPTQLQAMQVVAFSGDRKHLAALQPFLTNQTPTAQVAVAGNTPKIRQVRDEAMIYSAYLQGLDVSKFGVRIYQNGIFGTTLDLKAIGFATEQEREKAFGLWKQLQAEATAKAESSDPSHQEETAPIAPPELDDLDEKDQD